LTDTANKTKARRLAWTGVLVLFLAAIIAQSNSNLAFAVIGVGAGRRKRRGVIIGTALLITKQRGGRLLIFVGAATTIAGTVLSIIFQS
jgi:hypothetical protein